MVSQCKINECLFLAILFCLQPCGTELFWGKHMQSTMAAYKVQINGVFKSVLKVSNIFTFYKDPIGPYLLKVFYEYIHWVYIHGVFPLIMSVKSGIV